MTNVNLFIALLHALFITILFGMIAYFIMLMLRTIRRKRQDNDVLVSINLYLICYAKFDYNPNVALIRSLSPKIHIKVELLHQ